MDGLEISQREVRGVTVLDLSGRLVLENGVSMFLERMNQLRQAGHRWVLLNFDRVTYLDSAGVGAIASKYVSARNRDGDVKLLNLRPKSHTVLKTTKLLTVLESFESEQEAIASFPNNRQDDTRPFFTRDLS
jgi:anti-sigma B factor antagonist